MANADTSCNITYSDREESQLIKCQIYIKRSNTKASSTVSYVKCQKLNFLNFLDVTSDATD